MPGAKVAAHPRRAQAGAGARARLRLPAARHTVLVPGTRHGASKTTLAIAGATTIGAPLRPDRGMTHAERRP